MHDCVQRCTMGKCCCLVLVTIVAVLVLGLAIGIPVGMKKAKEKVKNWDPTAVNSACQSTRYPDTCNETFTGDYPRDTNGVMRHSVQSSEKGVNDTLGFMSEFDSSDPVISGAVEVCNEVLVSAREELEAASTALETKDTLGVDTLKDIQAWVSAAMELHTTCIDAFMEVNNVTGSALAKKSAKTDELLSNSLAFINALAQYGNDLLAWRPTGISLPEGFNFTLPNVTLPNIPGFGNRKLLSVEELEMDEGFPGWMDVETRRHLLQAPPKYDVVVAQDGSGNFRTIQAAVDAHKTNTKRLVIYIKAGIYNEQVIVPKKAKFLTLIGDGDRTVLTGDRNVALMKGMTTFKSATLSKLIVNSRSE